MNSIQIPTTETIIALNKFICDLAGDPHHCIDEVKIESAINTAFYPGSAPFQHGGLAKISGALCFYLIKGHAFVDGNKRTSALAAITFLNINGVDLEYQVDSRLGVNSLVAIIEKCASSAIGKDEFIQWFEIHKVILS